MGRGQGKFADGLREVVGYFGLGIVGLVGVLSCVGHKVGLAQARFADGQEWRFVVYAVPIINLLASFAASSMYVIPAVSVHVLTKTGGTLRIRG